MKKYAVIDIGTNSIKFIMFSLVNGKPFIIEEKSNISRLGENLHQTGLISPEAMKRNIEVLRRFIIIARDADVSDITALGTMCLRTAKNSALFCRKVRDELDLKIEVISGKEEARLSFMAVSATLGKESKDIVVFDTGGGSTEFLYGSRISESLSLNIGAVLLTQKYKSSQLAAMQKFLHQYFMEQIKDKKADILVGVGGAATTVSAVMRAMTVYEPSLIQGSIISRDEVNRQIKLYSQCSIKERKNIPGLRPERADIIIAGAAIIKEILDVFHKNTFTVSDYGLRYGLIYDRYIKNAQE